MMIESQTQISVDVIQPTQHTQLAGANKYYTFHVRGQDQKGSFTIHRRYSDFDLLRTLLSVRWPGIYIPPLPSKKTLVQQEAIFIEMRRIGLQWFMKQLSKRIHLWNSQETQIFLRNSTAQTDKILNSLSKVTTEGILNRYTDSFKYNSEIITGDDTPIIEMESYLKDVTIPVSVLLAEGQKALSVASTYNYMWKLTAVYLYKHQQIWNSYAHRINQPQTQSNQIEIGSDANNNNENNSTKNIGQSLFKPIHRLNTSKGKEVFVLNDQCNSSEAMRRLYEQTKMLSKQFESMSNALKSRRQCLASRQAALGKVKTLQLNVKQIQNGKASFFASFTKKSKENQLKEAEDQLNIAQKQLNLHSSLCDIITQHILQRQIGWFKLEVKKLYKKVLKDYLLLQLRRSRVSTQFWSQFEKQASNEPFSPLKKTNLIAQNPFAIGLGEQQAPPEIDADKQHLMEQTKEVGISEDEHNEVTHEGSIND